MAHFHVVDDYISVKNVFLKSSFKKIKYVKSKNANRTEADMNVMCLG